MVGLGLNLAGIRVFAWEVRSGVGCAIGLVLAFGDFVAGAASPATGAHPPPSLSSEEESVGVGTASADIRVRISVRVAVRVRVRVRVKIRLGSGLGLVLGQRECQD